MNEAELQRRIVELVKTLTAIQGAARGFIMEYDAERAGYGDGSALDQARVELLRALGDPQASEVESAIHLRDGGRG